MNEFGILPSMDAEVLQLALLDKGIQLMAYRREKIQQGPGFMLWASSKESLFLDDLFDSLRFLLSYIFNYSLVLTCQFDWVRPCCDQLLGSIQVSITNGW